MTFVRERVLVAADAFENLVESEGWKVNDPTQGQCRLCGKTFAKSGMGRHVRACRKRVDATGRSHALLLEVTDRYVPGYWLFLEAAPTATWADLDRFLRGIWLECCGHLSAFEYAGATFTSDPEGAREWADRPRSMAGRLVGTVEPGTRFHYEYDFGTSSELVGRALELVPSARAAHAIQVLARNEEPKRPCAECGQPATKVCGLCLGYRSSGDAACWYCGKCAAHHRCSDPGTDYFLPVVNSPRVGLCAYTGPAAG